MHAIDVDQLASATGGTASEKESGHIGNPQPKNYFPESSPTFATSHPQIPTAPKPGGLLGFSQPTLVPMHKG